MPKEIENEISNDVSIQINTTSKRRIEQGQRLIEIALDNCRPVRGTDGRYYIALNSRPYIALALGNTSSDAVLEICNIYFIESGKWPSQKATSLLSSYLFAQCRNAEPEEVNLRAGAYGDDIYLDMGDGEYRIIHIHRGGHEVLTSSPILFTRSHVSKSLPELKNSGHSLSELTRFIRIDIKALPVLISCMIATWMPRMPQPIIFLGGAARSGKTTSLRFILDCIDPSTEFPGASLTKDMRELKAQASLRRNFVFDNSSHVDAEISDLLARITTGGELISRAHYTNDEAHVTQLMRTVIINGIMEGFTRGDLASRSVSFELSAITGDDLTGFTNLNEEWKEFLPYFYTSLIEMTSHVLHELSTPREQVRSSHRNMDLVQIIAIVSNKMGIDGLAYLDESIKSLSSVVLSSSIFSDSLRKSFECALEFENKCRHVHVFTHDVDDSPAGTLLQCYLTPEELKEILSRHTEYDLRHELPSTGKALGEALKRMEGDLLTYFGIEMTKKKLNSGIRYMFRQVGAHVSA
jgi:hypothetical protein